MSLNEERNRISPNAPSVSRLQENNKSPSTETREAGQKNIDSKRPTTSRTQPSDMKEYSEIHTPGNSPESDTPGVIGS